MYLEFTNFTSFAVVFRKVSLIKFQMDISASSSPSACPLQSLSMDRSSSATDIKPIIGRCSSDSLPPSTITSPEGIGEVQNETAIPELADSQMKNLMDQFGPVCVTDHALKAYCRCIFCTVYCNNRAKIVMFYETSSQQIYQ